MDNEYRKDNTATKSQGSYTDYNGHTDNEGVV